MNPYLVMICVVVGSVLATVFLEWCSERNT